MVLQPQPTVIKIRYHSDSKTKDIRMERSDEVTSVNSMKDYKYYETLQ
jgi:hypothetical protein